MRMPRNAVHAAVNSPCRLLRIKTSSTQPASFPVQTMCHYEFEPPTLRPPSRASSRLWPANRGS